MTGSAPSDAIADAFETQRGRLLAVAYRMLGSRADAEDAAGSGRRVLVDGDPEIVACSANGTPLGVMVCTVVEGRIVEIQTLRAPERLAAMDFPGRPG